MGISINKFIDFDKKKKLFYDNIYFDDYKICVKIPLSEDEGIKKKTKVRIEKEIKVKKFDLVKYTYLLSYD